MKKILFVLTSLLFQFLVQSQTVKVFPLNNNQLGGLQSYTFGSTADGYVVFGGRLDGLHRRQPFAAFDIAGHNLNLSFINPANGNVAYHNTASLPDEVEEQMHSTNACFVQKDNLLLVAGGYGFSAIQNDHITFPSLLVFDLELLKSAVLTQGDLNASLLARIEDDRFAVTGGKLVKLNNQFFLVGGHRFDGRYNPMGPNNGPGFSQTYTSAIRRFEVSNNWVVSWFEEWYDETLLHRRDFNVLPSLDLSTMEEKISVYSGVFQVNADIPFLNAVNVDASGYNEVANFAQYYNHYHCAAFPLYNDQQQQIEHYFFGGIAQYYDSVGVLVQNNNVPFVKTIACVKQTGDGVWQESLIPQILPGYLGAGAELLLAPGMNEMNNGLIQMTTEQWAMDSVLVGYIYGGISSAEKNIFWSNAVLSTAANVWMRVYYYPEISNQVMNAQSVNGLKWHVYPNPFSNKINIQFHLDKAETVKLTWRDSAGKIVEETIIQNAKSGKNEYVYDDKAHWMGGTYLLTLETPNQTATQKVIFED
jgi:hypothetical protein